MGGDQQRVKNNNKQGTTMGNNDMQGTTTSGE
jgi:hypothetical protein